MSVKPASTVRLARPLLRVPAGLNTAIYLVVCQGGWFVCVLSAAHGLPWIGAVYVAMVLAYHFCCASRPGGELKLLGATLAIAAVWESFLVRAGVLTYPNGMLIAGTAPYWILALWALLAIQFNVLFAWLKPRLWLAAVLGAVGGPLSFRAGVALGAASFPHPGRSLAVLALGWGVLFPLSLVLARYWDK